MTDTTDAIVKASARAAHEALSRANVLAYLDMPEDTAEKVARAALAAALPMMREDIYEDQMVYIRACNAGGRIPMFHVAVPRIRARFDAMAKEINP